MRHAKKGFKLGRTRAHRKATLAALSTALIRHKRIETTVPKAKALRRYVEPLLNRAKSDTTHNRRQVFRYLQDKQAVTELFGDVASHIGDRSGGYTRIVKLGQRSGDSAPMAVIELVDYNDVQPGGGTSGSSRRTRRGGGRGRRRRGGSKGAAAATTSATQTADQTVGQGATDTVEQPISEDQAVPVPERTEDPAQEAQAEADQTDADAPEGEGDEKKEG